MMLESKQIHLSYNHSPVLSEVNVSFIEGKITSIIGPNGCGKSTFLQAIARQLTPDQGKIYLRGTDTTRWKRKDFAKEVAFLMQTHAQTPEITVSRLVEFGRFPHKKKFQRLAQEDYEVIEWAVHITQLEPLLDRNVQSLSGGERQRAWIAMALAQQPHLLLLDEPTTFLDIHHQLEIINMLKRLNKDHKMTIITVLHDMNQAAFVSDQIVVFKQGKLYRAGSPNEVITEMMLREVFNISAKITTEDGIPHISHMELIR
ncbi:ABC transporter ATP-binding protein [Bacillus horti]|uniref:Iron complex transport system ATP-binding protein n=1 Tax=Caldalkalibacillus horti TaxID=77523 RepID=A0ABT9VWF3_9BACI|nr:ABC transporter ATP-binding protein [Bacillus horti]MDQ0165323.1 iron complex transport system ATP-binding protein [Bacillus horti]